MGTPHYMAPELAHGVRGAKASSDIFSFGVLAYEVLVGELPFRLPAVFEALAGRDAQPSASLLERCPGLPPEAAASLDAARAMDPMARPTATMLAAVLLGAPIPVSDGLESYSESESARQPNRRWSNVVLHRKVGPGVDGVRFAE